MESHAPQSASLRQTHLAPADSSSGLANLNRKSFRGGTITFTAQGATLLISLLSTVVLARLLSPEDYGVLGMVFAITAFAGLFRDFGLSAATIQKKGLTREQQTNLFWINVAIGTALTLTIAACSPLVAAFYRRPEVLWATVAVSATFLIGSISAQSSAALVREMRFGHQAIATIGGALVSLVTSIALALAEFQYWALVWGHLAGTFATTVLLFFVSPFKPGWPRRDCSVRDMLRFGAHVTGFELVNYFQRNLDKLLLGRYWGADGLGLYTRAYSLLMLPISNIRGPINRVAFPGMSRCQQEPAILRNYFRDSTALLAFVSMPLTAWMYTVSEPVITVALGSRWIGAAPIFSLLAAAAFIQPAAGLAGSLLLSLGQGKRYFHCGLFNTTVLSIAVVIGLPWGTVGVAAAYAIGNYIVLLPYLTWAYRDTPVRLRDFFESVSIPALASLGAVLATHAVSLQWPQDPAWITLAVRTLIFGSVFLLLVTLQKEGRTQVGRFLRSLQELVFNSAASKVKS
jgi:polysaccharide transporter, PST family